MFSIRGKGFIRFKIGSRGVVRDQAPNPPPVGSLNSFSSQNGPSTEFDMRRSLRKSPYCNVYLLFDVPSRDQNSEQHLF